MPRALLDLGISNVLAPLRAISDDPWCPLDAHGGATVVLYPFIHGENA